jgi:hypothetical protein
VARQAADLQSLALNETDADERRGPLLVRHSKSDKRREAGMDQFGFEQLSASLAQRVELPPGPLSCVIDGSTRGRRCSPFNTGSINAHAVSTTG